MVKEWNVKRIRYVNHVVRFIFSLKKKKKKRMEKIESSSQCSTHGRSTTSRFLRNRNMKTFEKLFLNWNLFYVSCVITKKPVNYSLFVDELAIYTRRSSLTKSQNILQNMINHLQKWITDKGLKFSADKTVVLNFHRKWRSPPNVNLHIYGIPIINIE